MGHTKQSSSPHSLHAPNDSTSHTEPIFRHACHAGKALRRISTLHLHRLCHHQSSLSNSNFHVWFTGWLSYEYFMIFKTFYSLFQIAFLLLVSLTARRISSPDTPATVSCKEKLLIPLHDSLLIVLLDLWEQNILLLHEQRFGRLLDLQISHHWRCGKKRWMFPVLTFHCLLHQFSYLEIRHSMACEFMILRYVSVTWKE